MQVEEIVLYRYPGQEFPDNIDCLTLQRKTLEKPRDEKQVLWKTCFISIDPVMRVWLSGAKTYLPALRPTNNMHAFTIIQPNNSQDYYFATTGLRTHFYMDPHQNQMLFKIPQEIQKMLNDNGYPVASFLNLTLNGLPACEGLIKACDISKGQNVVISTAAGATGLMAIQIALSMGCKVVGLTSNQEKIDFLRQNFSSLKVINYKDQNYVKQIQEIFRDGIDAYFDCVGDEMLDNMLLLMKKNGKIALCGATQTYVNFGERKGLKNTSLIISKSLKLQGVTFQNENMHSYYQLMMDLLQKKQLKIFETYKVGMSNVKPAIQTLFQGKNIGKILIDVTGSIKPKL